MKGISLAVGLFVLVACSTPPPAKPDASAEQDVEVPDATPVLPGVKGCEGGQTQNPYPEGPYSYVKGQVAPDICLNGYVSTTERTLVPMALHDFYDPLETGPNRIMLLSGAMVWCGPCNNEALELPTVSAGISGQGAIIFQILLDGATFGVGPKESELQYWLDKHPLPFWVAMDPQRLSEKYFPTPHPPGLIIETKGMKILKELHGLYSAAQLQTMLLKCVADPTTC